jgi:hypothetical protein
VAARFPRTPFWVSREGQRGRVLVGDARLVSGTGTRTYRDYSAKRNIGNATIWT